MTVKQGIARAEINVGKMAQVKEGYFKFLRGKVIGYYANSGEIVIDGMHSNNNGAALIYLIKPKVPFGGYIFPAWRLEIIEDPKINRSLRIAEIKRLEDKLQRRRLFGYGPIIYSLDPHTKEKIEARIEELELSRDDEQYVPGEL